MRAYSTDQRLRVHGTELSSRCALAVLRGPAADPLKTLKVVVEGEIGRVKTIQMHRMAAFTWLDSRTVPNVFWSGGIIC
jgi:hypothetical protein